MPFQYLGAIIGIDKIRVADFEPLNARVRKKINTWKARSLSFTGKITLLKIVFQSIPIFILLASQVPNAVFDRLEQLFRMFLWSKDGNSQGLAAIKWEELCKSKENGGVALRRLSIFHQALLDKQIAKVLHF